MIGQHLKLRYLKPRNWCDKSEVLIHAMFEVLCRFIEDEAKWIAVINWDSDEEHAHAHKEMNDLYHWWTKIRPNRDKQDPLHTTKLVKPEMKSIPLNDGSDLMELKIIYNKNKKQWKKVYDASYAFETNCIAEDIQNMTRLAKIHRYMWT